MPRVDDRELAEARAQVIGLLLEVVKKMQANSDLDAEYLQLATGRRDPARMREIETERASNAGDIKKILDELGA